VNKGQRFNDVLVLSSIRHRVVRGYLGFATERWLLSTGFAGSESMFDEVVAGFSRIYAIALGPSSDNFWGCGNWQTAVESLNSSIA